MNILVTGANGQLGNEIRLISKNVKDEFIFTDIVTQEGVETTILDITDPKAIESFVFENNIKCIVNCAAYTNVDKAESDESLCYELNSIAPQSLAKAIKKINGLLIQISTDYVFGGDPYNTPCKEDQRGKPTGIYGKTKLEGENNIISIDCDYVIIRTSWLYSEYGHNFVKTMLNLISNKPMIKVVFDQVGTPTYAYDLANAIFAIINDYNNTSSNNSKSRYNKRGIYNYSNEGVCSWYDFAKTIARYSGEKSCNIVPCHSAEFPSSVIRPSYSVLDKTKIKQTFDIMIPYWVDSLKTCLCNIK